MANRQVEDCNGHTKDITRPFHGPWHDPVGEHIYVRSHLGRGTDSVFIRFCKSHKYFKDAKALQINKIFNISLIWHVKINQPPKNIGTLTKVFYTSGPNFVVLAWTCDELPCGQTQNGVNFDLEVKFDLEGQCQ